MNIAYLINTYPAPSVAFIRREILAHEAAGHQIRRYTVRRFPGELVDPQDREERARTRAILEAGVPRIAMAVIACLLTRPAALLRGLLATWSLSRKSARGVTIHLVYLAEACLLLRWLQRDPVRHLHAHFGTNAAALAMLCRIMGGVNYSFTVHGPEEFDNAPALGLDLKTHHADFVVAISDYGQSQLCRWVAPVDYSKLFVVHCGVDDFFRSTEAAEMSASPTLVFVGRLTATKGIFVLMDAVVRLRGKGITFELTIIGDGPETICPGGTCSAACVGGLRASRGLAERPGSARRDSPFSRSYFAESCRRASRRSDGGICTASPGD